MLRVTIHSQSYISSPTNLSCADFSFIICDGANVLLLESLCEKYPPHKENVELEEMPPSAVIINTCSGDSSLSGSSVALGVRARVMVEEDAPHAFTGNEWFLQGPRKPRVCRRDAVKDALEKAFASGYTGEQRLQVCAADNIFILQPMPGAPFYACEKWMVDVVYRAVKRQRFCAVENAVQQALMNILTEGKHSASGAEA